VFLAFSGNQSGRKRMKITFVDRVIRRLCAADYGFETRPIPHGRQIIFGDRSVLSLYLTGKHQWQGQPCDEKVLVEKLIAAARRKAGLTAVVQADGPGQKPTKAKAKPTAATRLRSLLDVDGETGWRKRT
jgi:hypothetical protein